MSPKSRAVAWGLFAAHVCALGAAAYVYAWYTNSVEGSGRWLASKRQLEQRVMGASAFAQSCHSLSGEQLDLGRWFGFQEVCLREPVAAREVEFDFEPLGAAHLAFLYGVGPEGASGVRVSSDPRFPAGRFRVDAFGEFSRFEPLPAFDVAPDEWAHVALAFAPDGVSAALDGGPAQPLGPAPASPQRFGFRGGFRSVLVDDVRVRCEGGGGFHETFFNARGFAFALLALSGILALELFLWRATRHDARVRVVLVAGASTLVFGALAALVLQRAKAGTYPRLDRTGEADWVAAETERVVAGIRAEHALAAPGTTRVLVVGTSQTWGAGATRAGEGFVEVLERLLAAAAPDRTWECINAGVSGLRAPRLLELLRAHWLALEPDVLVVNLSNNDKDPAMFEAALDGFARAAAEHGVPALFALEANASEAVAGELPLHPVMRRVAAAHGIPVVDAHRALAGAEPRGFLWWDHVHPTSFGHRLIAEALLPAVLARLGA